MEADLSKKAGYLIKYGAPLVIVCTFLITLAVFRYMDSTETIVVHDARVAGTFVNVKARADGVISQILVEDGASVNAGDALATIEVNITAESLEQLEKNVELAKQNLEELKKGQDITVPVVSTVDFSGAQADLARAEARKNRMEELFQMGAISAVKRDEAVSDYEAAKARASTVTTSQTYKTVHQATSPEILENANLAVRQAEIAFKRAKEDATATEIVSPIDGAFYRENAETGSEVQAGMRLFNIGDPTSMWIEARVKKDDTAKLRLGAPVSYEIDGKQFTGTIMEIEAEVEAAEQVATDGNAPSGEDDNKRVVKISLSGDGAAKKPGTPATVTFKI